MIYESLFVLEKHFQAELKIFEAMAKDKTVNDLDKAKWKQERKRFEAFLEVVLGFDEALSLPQSTRSQRCALGVAEILDS